MAKKIQLDVYLVGGAVRDQLLNRKVTERDYVVVGSSLEQMLELGFTQVGKDFPVFLHPRTKEEYALARTEKKKGKGYTGFICNTSAAVTLEEDLLRRDLTVNAMAFTDNGSLIDPYNGKKDLQDRILRHVSPAFNEDPLRVLRVARFAARYKYLGFTIADETVSLMSAISESGELALLSAERIWKEMESALTEKNPEIFILTLLHCSALHALWPELARLWSIKESDFSDSSLGESTIKALQLASQQSENTAIRFAALCHNIKGEVNDDNQLSSPNSLKNICQRLKVPNSVTSLTMKVWQYKAMADNALNLNNNELLELFDKMDVWRKYNEFLDFLTTCNAIALSNSKGTQGSYPQGEYLKSLVDLCRSVVAKPFVENGLKGLEIKNAIHQEKLSRVNHFIQNN